MTNRPTDSQMPGMLPALILLGSLALVLLILLPRPTPRAATTATASAEAAGVTDPAEATAAANAEGVAVVPTTAANEIMPDQPFSAETAFAWACAGCHGATGEGNPPFGQGILDSSLLNDDAAFLAFLTNAQPPVDPAIEYPHPWRGGYPTLTDEQLMALIAHVQTLAG